MYNPKTVRAAMGSLFRVDVRVCTDIAADIAKARSEGFGVYAAMLDKTSKNVCDLELGEGKIGFVIGNEGHGISELTKRLKNHTITIPMRKTQESLNAGVSAAICMYFLKNGELRQK